MFASIGLKIAIGIGIVGIAGGAWFYVQNLQSKLDLAAERQARTMDVVNAQEAVMKQLQNDIKKVQEVTNTLNQKIAEANKSVSNLNDKFDKNSSGKARDIGKDAEAKPEVVEKIINRATKDAIRCGELLTGAPLRPKETNSQCPELTVTKFEKSDKTDKADNKEDIRKSVK